MRCSFLALHDALREACDPRMNIIDSTWRNKSSTLNAHECLAMRVDALQSKTQYKHQYFFLKEKTCNPLQPISALNAIEFMYMPQYVRYCIEGEEYFQMFYHTPAKIRKRTKDINENMNLNFEPLDILDDFSKGVPEIATPNVKGVR